jgi:hypothetical protein
MVTWKAAQSYFRLAKECKPVDLILGSDGHQMMGMTGTLRIMAPKVIANIPCGLSSEVCSFGTLGVCL